MLIVFLISHENVCCGYSSDVPPSVFLCTQRFGGIGLFFFCPAYARITFPPDAVRFNCLRFSVQCFRHRRWLRATAYVFTLCESNVRFLVRAFGDGSGKVVRRPCRDHTEISQSSCSLRSLRTEIVQSPCGFRVKANWRWSGECNRRVVLGIRVPKVYNFTFLLV